MTEYSWFWGGTVTGDAAQATYGAPYTDASFSEAFSDALLTDPTTMGVVYRTDSPYSGNLAVSAPGGAIARVAAGKAIVNGRIYRNTANKDITVSGGDGTYYIILQSDIAGQVIRATYGVSPVMVQNANYWEILLATVVKSGGVITGVTDGRTFVNNSYSGTPVVTMTLIEEQYVSGAGGAQFDFTGIPQTYSHLKLEIVGRSLTYGGGAYSDGLRFNFNGDTGSNYNWNSWIWDRSLANFFYTNQAADSKLVLGMLPCADHTSGIPGSCTLTIHDYARSFWKRSCRMEYADTDLTSWAVGMDQGIWLNQASGISRIQIATDGTDNNANRYFAQYTRVSLYGL